MEVPDKPEGQCKATHLITGDIVHFGKYMQKPAETFGLVVMTPAQFLNSL